MVLSSLNNQQSTVPSIVVSKASWPEKIGSAADCEGKRAPTANVDRSMPDNIGTSVDSPRDEEEVDDQGEPIRPRSSSLTVTEGSKPRANVYDRPALPRTRRAPLLVDTSEPAASRLPPVDPAVDKNHRGSGLFRSFQLGKSKRKKSPITDDRRLSADLGAVALTEKSIKVKKRFEQTAAERENNLSRTPEMRTELRF